MLLWPHSCFFQLVTQIVASEPPVELSLLASVVRRAKQREIDGIMAQTSSSFALLAKAFSKKQPPDPRVDREEIQVPTFFNFFWADWMMVLGPSTYLNLQVLPHEKSYLLEMLLLQVLSVLLWTLAWRLADDMLEHRSRSSAIADRKKHDWKNLDDKLTRTEEDNIGCSSVQVQDLCVTYPADISLFSSCFARIRKFLRSTCLPRRRTNKVRGTSTSDEAASHQARTSDAQHVTALRGVSLAIQPGELFCLLGHNGAGKSTLIQVLTGLLHPTSGGVSIFGRRFFQDFRIKTAMSRNRSCCGSRSTKNLEAALKPDEQLVGLCPQQNFLFENLTVREALTVCVELRNWRIFPRSKSSSASSCSQFLQPLIKDVNAEVEFLLSEAGFAFEDENKLCSQLSGGWKRKLCCVVAFCGQPKLVVLDEPTSGMDPLNRRVTWDFILRRKRLGRTAILLTTHHMDEADLLSDKICILKDGEVECLGSPKFLKAQVNSGYQLVPTFVDTENYKDDSDRSASSGDREMKMVQEDADGNPYASCDVDPNKASALQCLEREIVNYAAEQDMLNAVDHHEESKSFLTYHSEAFSALAMSPAWVSKLRTDQFCNLLREIDRRSRRIGNIAHITFHMVTMEDVFLKVGRRDRSFQWPAAEDVDVRGRTSSENSDLATERPDAMEIDGSDGVHDLGVVASRTARCGGDEEVQDALMEHSCILDDECDPVVVVEDEEHTDETERELLLEENRRRKATKVSELRQSSSSWFSPFATLCKSEPRTWVSQFGCLFGRRATLLRARLPSVAGLFVSALIIVLFSTYTLFVVSRIFVLPDPYGIRSLLQPGSRNRNHSQNNGGSGSSETTSAAGDSWSSLVVEEHLGRLFSEADLPARIRSLTSSELAVANRVAGFLSSYFVLVTVGVFMLFAQGNLVQILCFRYVTLCLRVLAEDARSGFRELLFVNGCRTWVYWAANLLFDFLFLSCSVTGFFLLFHFVPIVFARLLNFEDGAVASTFSAAGGNQNNDPAGGFASQYDGWQFSSPFLGFQVFYNFNLDLHCSVVLAVCAFLVYLYLLHLVTENVSCPRLKLKYSKICGARKSSPDRAVYEEEEDELQVDSRRHRKVSPEKTLQCSADCSTSTDPGLQDADNMSALLSDAVDSRKESQWDGSYRKSSPKKPSALRSCCATLFKSVWRSSVSAVNQCPRRCCSCAARICCRKAHKVKVKRCCSRFWWQGRRSTGTNVAGTSASTRSLLRRNNTQHGCTRQSHEDGQKARQRCPAIKSKSHHALPFATSHLGSAQL
ncbi:unnamed protein product, partial [Amoebophrya sp. A120]|eukprot:GSA120T00011635001.1